jgi:hypothetical protein
MVALGMVAAALPALLYLAFEPSSADLAAQALRSDLFSAHGFLIWNDYWYSGHYLPGYSVLFPPLGAALGPRVVGALSAVAAAGLFGALARHRFGSAAWLATLWFGVGAVSLLIAGQLTFALGVAIGLGGLLALQRGRVALAVAAGVLAACASPVAGLFVALAGLAVALTGRRRDGIAVVAGATAPIAALALAFPTDGYFPFVASAFLPVPLLAAAALILLPAEERTLRVGVVLYTGLCLVLAIVHTPVGANAARLGSLFGGPVLALGLAGRRPVALALLAVPLLYWQWAAPVRDLANAVGDPSVERAYYAPLLAELQRRTEGAPVRVEIPPTQNRWEADYVAPRFPLARGWLRQLESEDFDLFTGGHLTPSAYRSWLYENGVGYVALPDADPDYLAEDEDALIRVGLPYLHPVWANRHWRLYAVRGTPGLVSPAGEASVAAGPRARLTSVGPASFTLSSRHAGRFLVRLHYTRYWTVAAGDACVQRDGDWTLVDATRDGGAVSVAARFSLAALLGRDRACSG